MWGSVAVAVAQVAEGFATVLLAALADLQRQHADQVVIARLSDQHDIAVARRNRWDVEGLGTDAA